MQRAEKRSRDRLRKELQQSVADKVKEWVLLCVPHVEQGVIERVVRQISREAVVMEDIAEEEDEQEGDSRDSPRFPRVGKGSGVVGAKRARSHPHRPDVFESPPHPAHTHQILSPLPLQHPPSLSLPSCTIQPSYLVSQCSDQGGVVSCILHAAACSLARAAARSASTCWFMRCSSLTLSRSTLCSPSSVISTSAVTSPPSAVGCFHLTR